MADSDMTSWEERIVANAHKHETVSDVLSLMDSEPFMNRGRWAAYVVRLGAANKRARETA